jgi:hypothetical protein
MSSKSTRARSTTHRTDSGALQEELLVDIRDPQKRGEKNGVLLKAQKYTSQVLDMEYQQPNS